jgi:hypothetical protein
VVERYTGQAMVHSVVHRVVPPSNKHGLKTACGINLVRLIEGSEGALYAKTDYTRDSLSVSRKGKPFDCQRCNRVLLIQHENSGFNISRGEAE